MNENAEPAKAERVECAAARDPAIRVFVIAAMLIGFGAWCFYDAYVKGSYPADKVETFNDALSYWFNHAGAFVFPALGLIPLVMGAAMLRRRVVADGEGIGFAGKARIAWGDVTRLDASRWDPKGILVLISADDAKLVLDEWKLDKTNFRTLVAFVEQHVPPEAMDNK